MNSFVNTTASAKQVEQMQSIYPQMCTLLNMVPHDVSMNVLIGLLAQECVMQNLNAMDVVTALQKYIDATAERRNKGSNKWQA